MVIRRPARQGNDANSPGKAIHADFSEIRIAGGDIPEASKVKRGRWSEQFMLGKIDAVAARGLAR